MLDREGDASYIGSVFVDMVGMCAPVAMGAVCIAGQAVPRQCIEMLEVSLHRRSSCASSVH